jgi:hypothetical protein
MSRVGNRAVLASDLSLASLYLLPSTLMPTLLIDEFESSSRGQHRDLLRFLRTPVRARG